MEQTAQTTHSLQPHIPTARLVRAAVVGIVCVLLYVLAGQASMDAAPDPRVQMLATVDLLADALTNADLEAARGLCTSTAATQLHLAGADALREELLTELGVTEADLYSQTNAALDDLLAAIAARLFTEVTFAERVTDYTALPDGSEAIGRVTLSVTGIGDVNTIRFLDAVNATNEDTAAYVAANTDNLVANLADGSEETLRQSLLNRALLSLFSTMTEQVQTQELPTIRYTLTFSFTTDKNGSAHCQIEAAAEE